MAPARERGPNRDRHERDNETEGGSATEPGSSRSGPVGASAGGGAAPPPSFEEAFRAAEGAVDALERGQLTLEESLGRYEQGLRAIGRCYEVLRAAEKRIEVLNAELGAVAEGAAGPEWVPAEGAPGLREALRATRPEGAGDGSPGAEGGGAGG